jgi:hypothetical protein
MNKYSEDYIPYAEEVHYNKIIEERNTPFGKYVVYYTANGDKITQDPGPFGNNQSIIKVNGDVLTKTPGPFGITTIFKTKTFTTTTTPGPFGTKTNTLNH